MFDSNKKPADLRKLRGGYYTPVKLADFLVQWAIRDGNERVLEPSAGDGNFVYAIATHPDNGVSWDPKIVAVEIEEDELEKAKKKIDSSPKKNMSVNWLLGDFFKLYQSLFSGERFDAVVGNPPFIRFQYFNEDSRETAFKHLRDAGYKPTKLANAWSAFIQLSIELLREGGRLAMVVPAELLQVTYANELRLRLSKRFDHIVLIGFKKLVFPEIQQEVLLLLAEGKRDVAGLPSDIHTLEFDDGEDLVRNGKLESAIAHIPSKHTRNGMKWTSLFLSNPSFEALDEAEKADSLEKLGKYADVDVGIVTGRNKFFVLTKEDRDKWGLEDFTIPIIGRTSTLNSIIYTKSDFKNFAEDNPAYLLHLADFEEEDFSKSLIKYLKSGKKAKVHEGYKCRVRKRWYEVPSVFVPDGFLFRQIYKYPLLVVNNSGAASTDTIHRVRFLNGAKPKLLAASFFNSLTLAWSEVGGRSYGGGVLELETREAEKMPIPYFENVDLDIEKVDTLQRQDKWEEALDYVDSVLLKDCVGFDNLMIRSLRKAWEELRDRRIVRR